MRKEKMGERERECVRVGGQWGRQEEKRKKIKIKYNNNNNNNKIKQNNIQK